MITRIEISGFKTFTDFAVDLAPFTVIAGANASGKSNLLDALRLLASLSSRQPVLMPYLSERRATAIFTKYPGGDEATSIRIAAEFLLPPHLPQEKIWNFRYRRLRYAITIVKSDDSGTDYPYMVADETLDPIAYTADTWQRTLTEQQERNLSIPDIADGSSIGDLSEISINDKRFKATRTDLTLTEISQATKSSDLHLYALKVELQALRYTDLINPANFTNYSGHTETVPTLVLRGLIRAKKAGTLGAINAKLRKVIKEVRGLDVYVDELERGTVLIEDNSGRKFLPDSLSEGTLRVISITAMLLNENTTQCILVEEPENGVDPRIMHELLSVLLDLASDLESDPLDVRQVICTTHSPTFLQAALQRQEGRGGIGVLLTTKVTALITVDGQRRKLPTTRMNEVTTQDSEDGSENSLRRYTLSQALDYLNRLELPDGWQEKLTNA